MERVSVCVFWLLFSVFVALVSLAVSMAATMLSETCLGTLVVSLAVVLLGWALIAQFFYTLGTGLGMSMVSTRQAYLRKRFFSLAALPCGGIPLYVVAACFAQFVPINPLWVVVAWAVVLVAANAALDLVVMRHAPCHST